MAARKLWKVTQGWTSGMAVDPSTVQRPESKAKVYTIYVPNAVRGSTSHDHVDVWIDERNGHGWQHYERILKADWLAIQTGKIK